MRKGFLIYEEMRKYFPIHEEAVSHIWLWNFSILNFPIHEEILIFFFYQCVFLTLSCLWIYLRSFFSLFWISVSVRLLFLYVSFCFSVSFFCLSCCSLSLLDFFAWFLLGSRKERCVRGRSIEEGRGHCHRFSLFKFTPGCVQRHSLMFNTLPSLTISIRIHCVAGRGCCVVLETILYCRTFTLRTGPNSESTNCLATPRQKCMRGGGGEGASEK